ncbi:MaoC family dehydratase N-terminal domain-containing protein [Canibacter sp. lx-72]|uniref:FAS1-like dehydratase domain-containing protein n=1 Tax=Canibacter zhuwentaonis TaxID=2837491 RepID=UPI001BDBDA70|nr:MaoC family dehydratase N-terminal domain-containing protein [Canibacter zhuwentaonis]MBT1035602.1 MaoC family dehydratase N-terminal domain-containing protein [Canibacter zhuwentaonis]
MINKDIAGKTYSLLAGYLVGREKLREFAKAVLVTNPVYHDVAAAQAAGYADLVASPTFAVVLQERTLALLLADESANIDFSRVVHGEQRFTYTRPIVAGDELTAQMMVTSVKEIAGNAMVTAETVITDSAGEHVVTTISSLVVRGE